MKGPRCVTPACRRRGHASRRGLCTTHASRWWHLWSDVSYYAYEAAYWRNCDPSDSDAVMRRYELQADRIKPYTRADAQRLADDYDRRGEKALARMQQILPGPLGLDFVFWLEHQSAVVRPKLDVVPISSNKQPARAVTEMAITQQTVTVNAGNIGGA